jgi:YggT family protein
MDASYLTNPLAFLVQVLLGLYALVIVLRFLLQYVRADFYNPVSQFVVQVTDPAVRPLRRLVPGWGGWDFGSLILAWLVKALELLIVLLLKGAGLHLIGPLLWALPELVALVINVFLFAVLIQVIMSWINPGGYNPALELVERLTEPLLAPARRLLPPISGLDLSPMLVMLGLVVLEMLVLPPLRALTGSPL